ncbi:MAG: PEGA domain-containing protein [Myxococcota bacterium]
MASGNDGGKRQPPTDDRTLLDPLSNEELKALREARQRMQAKRKQGNAGASAIKHQIVIGPSASEEDGDAPTRAMPSLPSFDGEVTLDKLDLGPKAEAKAPQSPAPTPEVPSAPKAPPRKMSARPVSERRRPPNQVTQPGADPRAQVESPVGAPSGKAGPTGFGENTMMWMQPAKAPTGVVSTAPTNTTLPIPTPKQQGMAWAQRIGVLALLLLMAGVVTFILWPRQKGTLELYTTPPGASLYIDGSARDEPTPVKLTLGVGSHSLRLEKGGYESATLTVEVLADTEARQDVDLVPLSQPGLQTVGVRVEPVKADVTFDDTKHASVRSLQLPNVDPNREHVIRVEAPGFLKTEQRIPAGQLQKAYTFTLEPDEE